jgi:hypothetical protein
MQNGYIAKRGAIAGLDDVEKYQQDDDCERDAEKPQYDRHLISLDLVRAQSYLLDLVPLARNRLDLR